MWPFSKAKKPERRTLLDYIQPHAYCHLLSFIEEVRFAICRRHDDEGKGFALSAYSSSILHSLTLAVQTEQIRAMQRYPIEPCSEDSKVN